MTSQRAGEGFWADVTHKGRKLRLFSEVTVAGVFACVFDLDTEKWLVREWADNLEDGKCRAEKLGEAVLDETLPAIAWNERKQA